VFGLGEFVVRAGLPQGPSGADVAGGAEEEREIGAQTTFDAGVADPIDRMLAVHLAGGLPAGAPVGASSPGPHHSETFDIAEDAIGIGIDVLESLLRRDG
jgi:metal-dependent amidase/aminoacylase/carboxypeptidase family protein